MNEQTIQDNHNPNNQSKTNNYLFYVMVIILILFVIYMSTKNGFYQGFGNQSSFTHKNIPKSATITGINVTKSVNETRVIIVIDIKKTKNNTYNVTTIDGSNIIVNGSLSGNFTNK